MVAWGFVSRVSARVFGTMASDPSGPRVEAIVLRTVGPQGSLFELLLPAGMRVLSGELADVDALLEDERFFQPEVCPTLPRRSCW